MPDRRQVLRAGLLAAAGLAVPAGCGVPGGGRPVVDGDGPKPGGSGANGTGLEPPGPEGAGDPVVLVQRYLEALSGKLDTDDARTKAVDRARAFLTPNAARSWQPGASITVVRIVGNLAQAVAPGGAFSVTGQLQPVGAIDDSSGSVKPITNTRIIPASFQVVPNLDSSRPLVTLLIEALPAGLGQLLAETALTRWYDAQLLYFWDSEQKGLVPDLRYVPKSLQAQVAARATEIVNWLLAGPSVFLQGAVSSMPSGIQLAGPNASLDGGRLSVTLSGVPPTADVNKITSQLRWSLRPTYTDPLNLVIQGRQVKPDGASQQYLDQSLADRRYRSAIPEAYAVAGGVVRSLRDPTVVPAVLAAPENTGVQFAALSRDDAPQAALIRGGRLWFGQPGRVGTPPSYQKVAGLGPAVAQRPMWLSTPTPSVLVVAEDGGLYQVAVNQTVTPLPVGGVDQLTAFSVAPDQRRIALIGDGAAWVAPLVWNGDTVSVGNTRRVYAPPQELRSIAWTRLDRVVVAGGSGTWVLTEVSIDGTYYSPPIGSALTSPITQVVGYPYLLSQRIDQPTPSGPLMVQTEATAYKVYPSSIQPLEYDRVPSPSPSAGASPPVIPPPTYPFFID